MEGYVKPISLFDCLTCKLALKSNAEFKYHKMFHLCPERYACLNIDIINFSIQKDKTRSMHCSICDKAIHTEEELEKHLKDINHQKWIIFLQCLKVNALKNELVEYAVNLNINCNSNETNIVLSKNLYCQVCDKSLPYSHRIKKSMKNHENGKKHKRKFMSPMMKNKEFNLTSISDDCIPVYICFICNVEFMEENSLYGHYNDEIHHYRAKVLYALSSDKNIIISEDKVLQCKTCNIETTDLECILLHIFGSEHKNKIKEINVSSSVKAIDRNVSCNLESSKNLATSSSD